MKKIVLTGGGTAGHVTPNIALIPELQKNGWDISYVGTENGIEHELIEREGIPYYSVRSGKLRRYLSKENIKDAFRVIGGISDAKKVLKEIKPDVIFSKGNYIFSMGIHDFFSSKPFIKKAKIRLRIQQKLGLPFFLHKNRKRKLWAAGFLSFFVFLWVLAF